MACIERRFGNTNLRALRPTAVYSSPGTLIGYAAKFSSGSNQNWSEDLGGFRERLAQNCFSRSLRNGDDVRACINHDPNFVIGRVRSKTLLLSQDDIGLRSEIILPNTSFARDLYESVARGDLSEMSFAFECEEDEWGDCVDPDDRSMMRIRTVRSAKLIDVSAVCYPAYKSSSISTSDQFAAAAGRSMHSFDQFFPSGIPLEVRSHVGGDIRERLELRRDSRRRLTNSVLSI